MKTAVSVLVALLFTTRASAADPVVLNPGRHTSTDFLARASADGKVVVTLSSDLCVRVWDAATGKPVRELWVTPLLGAAQPWGHMWLAPDGKVLALRFHAPNGTGGKFALVPLDGPDVGTYRLLDGHPLPVDHLAFSPDGKRIATACPQSPILVWDTVTGKKVCEIKHDDRRATGLTFAPDGTKLTVALSPFMATEEARSTVANYDAGTGKRAGEFEHGDSRTIDHGRPMWSPDGKTLALHRHVLTLRESDGFLVRTIGNTRTEGQVSWPIVADFDTKGRLLAAWVEKDGWLVRDETANKDLARIKHPDPLSVAGIALVASGHLLVPASNGITLYNLFKPSAPPTKWFVAEPPPSAIGWAKGPTLVWGFGRDMRGNGDPFFAAVDLGATKSVPIPSEGVMRRAFESAGVKLYNEGTRAITVTNGQTVAIDFRAGFDWEGIETATLLGPDLVVASTSDGLITFDRKTGKRITAHNGGVPLVLAAAPDARFFATSSGHDPLIHVYRPMQVEPVLTVFVAGAEWVAWAPDGAWASSPGTERWAGSLTKEPAGKLPTFVPFDPKKRNPDKIKAALK